MVTFLDVKDEEKKKVMYLFLQNFFDGLGTSFFYATGIFVFLGNSTHHGALHYYPLVFLIGGILIFISGRVYVKAEARTRIDYLLYWLGLVIIVIVVVAYIMLTIKTSLVHGIVLLILYHLIYYLRQTQFWGLSSLSFNVLQSKRLFSIVSAGDLPAKFFGYTLIYNLLESGTLLPEQLVYFALAAYLVGFYFLRKVFFSDPFLRHGSHQHFKSGIHEIRFFGNNFIQTMAIMAFFIICVFFILDYTFTKVVMHKINVEDTDMYYLVSTVLYVSYGLAALLKLFLTGRVFQYLGLKWTMVLTPALMLILIVSVFGISSISSDTNWYYVRLFIFLYIVFIVFRNVIGKPVFFTLFQPLSKKMRLHGHNIVKGFAEPLGMIISGGLLLIYYNYLEEYRLDIFAVMLLFVVLLWMISSRNVRKRYFEMLRNVINLRLISGNQLIMNDSKTNQKLISYLESDDDAEVLFALDHIKNYNLSFKLIIPLLHRESELVRMASWELLSKTCNGGQFEELIVIHFEKNCSQSLRQKVYFLLGMMTNEADVLYRHITEEYPDILESMLEGWFITRKLDLPQEFYDTTNNYLKSSSPELFNSGLRLQKFLPSNAGKNYIAESLESEDEEQQRSAIVGSFGFLEPKFFKIILSQVGNPLNNRTFRDELIKLGDKGLKYYLPFLKDADDINTFRLIQIIEKIGSDKAINKLVELLKFNNPDLRKTILESLIRLGPDKLKPYNGSLEKELVREIELGKEILSVYDLNQPEFNFLHEELKDLIRRIFKLLSLLHDPNVIKRTEEGVFSFYPDRRANAIETLNNTLTHEQFKLLEQVLESTVNPRRNNISNRNCGFLLKHQASLNKWTVACLLARFGCDDEITIKNLLRRNTAIINEHLKSGEMEKGDTSRIMEKVIMLTKLELFSDTPKNVLVEVAGLLKEERHEMNSTIFKKGDKGESMYIIYTGEVKIHDEKSILAIFGERDIFGELSMLDSETRSATATTTKESVLFHLEQKAIYELMNDRIEIAKSIFRTLCTRLRELNKKFVEVENKE